MALTLAIVVVGLAGKAVVDKAVALQGGAEAVGLWGQIGSLTGLLSTISLSGLGAGLVVNTARTVNPAHRLALLVAAIGLSLFFSGLLLFPLLWFPRLSDQLTGATLPPLLLFMAAISGWLEVIPGMVTASWQGGERRWHILGLVVMGALVSLAAIFWPGDSPLMVRLLLGQTLFSLLLALGVVVYASFAPGWHVLLNRCWSPLLAYLPAALAIGILSPLSSLLLRTTLASSLSWGDMGIIQAQWRITDWITTIASGVMGFYFLPRLGAAVKKEEFFPIIHTMIRTLFWPGGVLLLGFFLLRQPVTTFFYLEGFPVEATASGLLLLGDWCRIYAWVWLNALFARGQSMAVAVGEFLSLPLFALLLWLFREHLTPVLAGLLWLCCYLSYGLFNRWMVLRRWRVKSSFGQ
ncbi:MAG: hypothetical protein G8345_04225 [Magnetococcales bacterium]|nr:hypothetical protein [Magnetococcales bacterium]NGZ26077.1 hypothetical protein [Magnetococcales bacterium]